MEASTPAAPGRETAVARIKHFGAHIKGFVPKIAVPVLAVATVAALLALREFDGYLAQLQHEGHGSYTMSDLAPLNPVGLIETVEGVLRVWNKDGEAAATAVFWHLWLDTVVLIPAYGALLAILLVRAKQSVPDSERNAELLALASRGMVAVGGVVVADLVENVSRMRIIWGDDTSAWLVRLAWGSAWVKWAFLALALALLASLAVAARSGRRSEQGDDDHAPWRVRVPLVLIAVWSLFLLFDPSGQVHDLIRRWLDDTELLLQGVGTLIAALVFGLATWTVTRRVLFVRADAVKDNAPKKDNEPKKDDELKELSLVSMAIVAVAAAAVAWLCGWRNLGGTAAVFGALVVLSLVVPGRARERPSGPDKRAQTARPAKGTEAASIKRIAWGLAVVPPVVLLLATGAAMVVPAVVLSVDSAVGDLGEEATLLAFVAPVLGLVLTGLAARAAAKVSSRWQEPEPVERRHVAVWALAVGTAVAAIAWRVEVPPALGGITIVTAAVVLLMLLLGEGQRYGECHRPPAILGAMGFVRVPVVAIVAAVLVVSSLLDKGGYHDAHLSKGPKFSRDGVSLASAWEKWKSRNCVADSTEPVPLVFVANHGGGIRAAYWTGSVLTELFGAPAAWRTDCANARTIDRVFALGGTSGGAVGVASYIGYAGSEGSAKWYEQALGRTDFLSSGISWGALVDLPRAFIGFNGPDRARRLEEAWERKIAGMDESFFRPAPPLLLFGGAQVETGCRLNVSRIRLTDHENGAPPTACNAVLSRSATTRMRELGAEPRIERQVPDAALTSDVLDYLCEDRKSLKRSTAALLSARFPYVSPSGRLPLCGTEDHTLVVDGGYAENSGGQGVLDLWARLRPFVLAHNRRRAGALVVPIFVHVDNHYAKAASAAPRSRPKELLIPPSTAGRPDKLDDLGVEQLANATFSSGVPGRPGVFCRIGKGPAQRFVRIAPTDSPGVPAPLAWTLSKMATDELDGQRKSAFAEPPVQTLKEIVREPARLNDLCSKPAKS